MITILGLFCPAGEDRNRRQTALALVPGARPRKVRPSVEIRAMRYIPLCLILEQTIKCRQAGVVSGELDLTLVRCWLLIRPQQQANKFLLWLWLR
jgi:hypothetical protein